MCTCGKWKVSNKDFCIKGVANRKTVCYDKYIEKGMKKKYDYSKWT
ncbi:gp143 [Brochothrix phage A9]|uniref:Gp143 n=1 Tax=Brochothrix phage A9 TaxID=857312 RepID=D9J0U0_9CAUD|nr:gp143 [Brochothrix phage A9]ADJ53177.1 gp143 [Brochothrix phage A9]